jgi:hypothetical protein
LYLVYTSTAGVTLSTPGLFSATVPSEGHGGKEVDGLCRALGEIGEIATHCQSGYGSVASLIL